MSNIQASAAMELQMNIVNGYCGVATIVVNLLTVVVFLKDRSLRERYLFILIAVGDLLNGIYFAYAGFTREKEMKSAAYYAPISPWECAMKFYATFQIIGIQLPDLASLMISIERVLAVQLPFWYRARFHFQHRFGLLLFCVILSTVSLIIYFLTVLPLQEKIVPWASCSMTFSSHPVYSTMHQILIVVVQISAFSLSVFAFTQARKNSGAIAAVRKEVQNIKPILAVSFLSVILVTVPQIYVLSLRFLGLQVYGYLLYIILLLPCINSFMNFFVYLWLTGEFRNRLLELIFCQKISHQTTIVASISLGQPRINQVSCITKR